MMLAARFSEVKVRSGGVWSNCESSVFDDNKVRKRMFKLRCVQCKQQEETALKRSHTPLGRGND